MGKNMKISEHIYNYSDTGNNHDGNLFKTEAKTTHRGIAKPNPRYAARIPCQKIQKVWQTKLSLRRGTGTRGLCPFCQYAWQKPSYGLRFSQNVNGNRKFPHFGN